MRAPILKMEGLLYSILTDHVYKTLRLSDFTAVRADGIEPPGSHHRFMLMADDLWSLKA